MGGGTVRNEIKELNGLCKLAAELERKWDRAGEDYLGTKITAGDYTRFVEEYLNSVRRLEMALCKHLVAVTAEAARDRTVRQEPQPEHRGPA
jgi:hypothetical protein